MSEQAIAKIKNYQIQPLRLKKKLTFLKLRLSHISRIATKLLKKGCKRFVLQQLGKWFTQWQRKEWLIYLKDINNLTEKELYTKYQKKLEFINYLKLYKNHIPQHTIFNWKLQQFNILFRLDNPQNKLEPYIRYLTKNKRDYYAIHILTMLIKAVNTKEKNFLNSFDTTIKNVLEINNNNNDITYFKLNIYRGIIYRHQ